MAEATFTDWRGETVVLCSDVPDKATAIELSRYAQKAYNMGRDDEGRIMDDRISAAFAVARNEREQAERRY